MYGRYSVFEMAKEFRKNKPLLTAYLQGKSIENFGDDAIMGMAAGTFLIIFLLSIIVWIWALVVLIKYWNALPVISKVLGVIGLLFPVPGPLLTLIAVYIGKGSGKSGKSGFRTGFKSGFKSCSSCSKW